MSPATAPAAGSIARVCGAGRFVPHFRSRSIGSESVLAESESDGRLRLRVETEIAVHRFALRQTVVAGFSADLRPEWCALDACVNSRRLSLEVEIGPESAVTRHRTGDRVRSAQFGLERPPLLLIDNCFATHALAALWVLRRAPAPEPFVSLPAREDLPVSRSGGIKVLLGGREYAPPALSFHLTPELDEHVWVSDDWVERMVIPQTQMRVEWMATLPPRGGSS